jgi:hypothetical protein
MQTLAQLKNGELKGAKELKLCEGFSHFPTEIFELADTLEKLDLSGNNLTELPADLGRLKKLRILFCSDNPFTILPEVLEDCPELDTVGFKSNKIEVVPPRALNPNLRWLILTNNCISELPAAIGRCTRMQKLALAGNRLTTLPVELSNCRNLGLLRISANQLKAFPQWLLSMPSLAWLAFSGNPFCIRPQITPTPAIHWQELQLNEVLGQGASGVIYKAAWHGREVTKNVAVKIFKGDVTSDGLPEDEMNAFIAAGAHPGLVKLIGHIEGHPQEGKGLVMELIPDRFYNLGLPPSLASCTRDVFKPGAVLTAAQVVKIVATIASVSAQLHSHGIIHGDLYAHNTLVDADANTLFGDFGAAGFYDVSGKEASALERIEVRSFGYMIDDLLGICSDDGALVKDLQDIRDTCLVDNVAARPSFSHLAAALGRLI